MTSFADPRLELAVRAALPQEVLAQPLSSLTNLDAADLGIRRLGGIASLRELRFANLSGNPIASLVELGANAKLIQLALRGIWASSVEGLSGLPNLEAVDLYGSRVVSIAALAGSPALRSLDLGRCIVADLAPLETLTRLESLTLGNPNLHIPRGSVFSSPDIVELDLASLRGLSCLRQLRLYGLHIKSCALFDELVNLEELVLEGCSFGDDLRGLRRLPRLELLSLGGCSRPELGALEGQERLRVLILDDTVLDSVEALESLESLELVSLRAAKLDDRGSVRRLAKNPRLRELREGDRLIDVG